MDNADQTTRAESDLEQDPILPPGEDPDESDLDQDPILPPGEDPDESDSDSESSSD
jgi:hypothetical protein